MKYLLMLCVMGLIGFAMFAGYVDNWKMFWVSFPLAFVFGIILVGVYAIEDVNRNGHRKGDED